MISAVHRANKSYKFAGRMAVSTTTTRAKSKLFGRFEVASGN
jgi:hypothetical protein